MKEKNDLQYLVRLSPLNGELWGILTSHVSSCEVHDPVEPLPEGEVPVWQGLPTELGPRDHEGLEVVRAEVGVPEGIFLCKMCFFSSFSQNIKTSYSNNQFTSNDFFRLLRNGKQFTFHRTYIF